MKKRNLYSWLALATILIGELLAIRAIHHPDPLWWWLVGVAVLVFLGLWLKGLRVRRRSGANSVILTKLLANAIVPRPIGSIYLLVFVIHLGWLSNAVFNLFVPTESVVDTLTAIAVNLVSMIALIMAFPNAITPKSDKARKVFISGISKVNAYTMNVRPIVRMLQLTEDADDCCRIAILHSNYYSLPDNRENARQSFDAYFDAIISELPSDELRSRFVSMRDATAPDDITARLAILIRMVALVEFPQKLWILSPDKLQISFSEPCDYNRVDICYHIVEKIVKDSDTPDNVLYFNISPATANVSALLTLLAIDGSRKLYYYISDDVSKSDPTRPPKTEEEKQKCLIEVNKTDIPLHNLLSQALDSFEMEI